MTQLRPSDIERTKLTANFFNAIASGVVLTAIVVPFIGVTLGTIKVTTDLVSAVSLSALGLTLAIVIHLVARRMLLGLDE